MQRILRGKTGQGTGGRKPDIHSIFIGVRIQQ